MVFFEYWFYSVFRHSLGATGPAGKVGSRTGHVLGVGHHLAVRNPVLIVLGVSPETPTPLVVVVHFPLEGVK
jgi:hypothetical protein